MRKATGPSTDVVVAVLERASYRCGRCQRNASGVCCSSHNKLLCHRCYRATHFVEVCVVGCTECAAERLPLVLVHDA